MSTIKRDGYRRGDVVVVVGDAFWASYPDLSFRNPYATFVEITDFMPNDFLRGRTNTGRAGVASVADVHMSQVRGKVERDV